MAQMNEKNELVNAQGMTEQEFLTWYQKEQKNKYEKPSVTVDMLIFTVADGQSKGVRKLPEKELRVLLVKRKDHPFMGKWAIPGGFAGMDEDLETSAMRELKEETNLENIYMEQLYTWGDVERDPRMRVISTSYMALVDSENLDVKAGDDAEDAKWFTIKKNVLEEIKEKDGNKLINTQKVELELISEDKEVYILSTLVVKKITEHTVTKTEVEVVGFNHIAFDHLKIIHYALERLVNKVEYTPIAFNLMPEYFTLTELQMVYETILGRDLIKANFRRKIAPMVIETELVKSESAHRPSKLYTYNPDWVMTTF